MAYACEQTLRAPPLSLPAGVAAPARGPPRVLIEVDAAGGGALVLAIGVHPGVRPGAVALNAVHRRQLRRENGEATTARLVRPGTHPRAAAASFRLDFVRREVGKRAEVPHKEVVAALKKTLDGHVVTRGQSVVLDLCGHKLQAVADDLGVPAAADDAGGSAAADVRAVQRAAVGASTVVSVEAEKLSGVSVTGRPVMAAQLAKFQHFDFARLGIGGLDAQFRDIFRRAFASRVFPPDVVARLGIQHVKGMLLHGPPGTGKTLIARQIGKLLNAVEPKVVNGPEVLNKYVGQSEENIRKLFADAEADQSKNGDSSQLHIIIFDEIDAVCRQRGSGSAGGTGVGDSVVNQLLTKIDGVNALNNILLIGMTNRKDLLDEALLRPGRLEVQVEVGLPDEKGRSQILGIHTKSMAGSHFLGADVDLADLASITKNYSGAELEGLVKSAVSFALDRHVDVGDLSREVDTDALKVTAADFARALDEVRPAFGVTEKALAGCLPYGIIDHGPGHRHLQGLLTSVVRQAEESTRTPLLTCLLTGPAGSGKTALAADAARRSGFAMQRLVSPADMVGFSEAAKVQAIEKAFDDAGKSDSAFLVLDDVERLIEWVPIGPRFSNHVLQSLLVLLKRPPPAGRRLVVVATTALGEAARALGLEAAFDVWHSVPALRPADAGRVLSALGAFEGPDLERAVVPLGTGGVPIKRLLTLVEMARFGPGGGGGGADGGGGGGAAAGPLPLEAWHRAITDVGVEADEDRLST